MSFETSINRRINNIDKSIESETALLLETSEKLGRMRKAKTEFQRIRTDLIVERNKCLEPDFSTGTFHGSQANNFDTFREGTLLSRYKEMSEEQMLDVLTLMEEEVERLNDKAVAINNGIAELRQNRTTLEGQLERELANK